VNRARMWIGRPLWAAGGALLLGAAMTARAEAQDSAGIRIDQIDLRKLPEIAVRFSVRNPDGSYLPGLGVRDLEVSVDGSPPESLRLSNHLLEGGRLAVAFVVDVSGSTQPVLPAAKDALRDLIAALGPDADVAVITVGDSAAVLASLGVPPDVAIARLESLPRASRTALFDGLELAARQAAAGLASWRYVVALTDGRDTGSRVRHADALNVARSLGVPVFVVGLATDADTAALGATADGTGGRLFWWSDRPSLQRAYAAMAGQIRNEYRLGFQLDGVFDEWHTLEIRLVSPPADWESELGVTERSFIATLGPGRDRRDVRGVLSSGGAVRGASAWAVAFVIFCSLLFSIALLMRDRIPPERRGAVLLLALLLAAAAATGAALTWVLVAG
jgi:hypothetical protein